MARKATASIARRNIGFSSNTLAYMVKIDWTAAPVVKVTTRQPIKLAMQQVAVCHGRYVPQKDITGSFDAGTILRFVASSRGDGWYYLVVAGRCTCPAHHFGKSCKHMVQVASAEARKQARNERAAAVAEAEAQVERDRKRLAFERVRAEVVAIEARTHALTPKRVVQAEDAAEREASSQRRHLPPLNSNAGFSLLMPERHATPRWPQRQQETW